MDIRKMKFLYVPTEGVNYDLLWGLLELGYDTECFPEVCMVNDPDEARINKLEGYLENADIAFTQKFSGEVAEACHRKKTIYISWTFDSPQKELYLDEARYETNYIFAFDRRQMNRMRAHGLKNIFFEPLATNITRVSAISICDEDMVTYGHQISFVGNLRQNKSRQAFIESTQGDIREYICEKIRKIAGNWNEECDPYRPYPENVVTSIDCTLNRDSRCDRLIDADYLVQTMVADEISYQDRILVLNMLAKKYEVALYTSNGKDNKDLGENVTVLPPVSYEEVMPKIFYASKINLNITKRSIETGVPLRVFDILGVGGFVLTDEKEELHELFEVGKEIETYSCMEDLTEKADYYLNNEKQRLRIACEGYKKVKENYTYPKAIERMLKKVLSD